jgi:predicted nucleotidyltransferase
LSLRRLVGALADCGVEFVIVGMVAGNLHGSQYATEDLDVVYDTATKNIETLCAALVPLRPRVAESWPLEGSEALFTPATLIAERSVTVITDEGEIDLLHRIDGVGAYPDVLATSEEIELDGRKIAVISLRGLIAAKRASAREKDRVHLRELELIDELRGFER